MRSVAWSRCSTLRYEHRQEDKRSGAGDSLQQVLQFLGAFELPDEWRPEL